MSYKQATHFTRGIARGFLGVSAIGCALLGGCHRHESDCAQIRVIDAIPDADRILVGLPGKRDRARLRFRQEISYEVAPEGSCRPEFIAERGGADTRAFLAPPCTVIAKRRYAAIATGVLDGNPPPSLHLFEETPSIYPLKNTQTLVRVVNAAPDAGPIDVLFNNLVTFKNLPFERMSYAVALPAAHYTITAKTAGERFTPLTLPKPIALSGGTSYLLVVSGRARDGSISFDAYEN